MVQDHMVLDHMSRPKSPKKDHYMEKANRTGSIGGNVNVETPKVKLVAK